MKRSHAGWQRVLMFIIPYILVVGLFQFVGMLIAQIDYNDLNVQKTTGQEFIVTLFSLLGTVLVIWGFMRSLDHEKFVLVGLQTKSRLNDFIVGFTIGAFVMIVAYLLLTTIDEIQFEKVVFNPSEIIYSILLFIAVAFMEEILMRGYILKNLMLSFNKYIALIISSILFSLMHAFNPNIDLVSMIELFLAGILLGATYMYTKNLWFPIGLHLSWNLFQTLLGFNVSGQDTYSLIEISMKENNLINGGAFGFEGSILSIISSIIIIIGIWFYYNNYKIEKKNVC